MKKKVSFKRVQFKYIKKNKNERNLKDINKQIKENLNSLEILIEAKNYRKKDYSNINKSYLSKYFQGLGVSMFSRSHRTREEKRKIYLKKYYMKNKEKNKIINLT